MRRVLAVRRHDRQARRRALPPSRPARRRSGSRCACRRAWIASRASSLRPAGTRPGCPTAGSSSRRRPRCTCRPGRGRSGCGWCPSRGGSRPARRARGSLITSAPPSPQVRFLVSWKLSVEVAPTLPSGAAAVAAEQAVRVVLDHRQAVAAGDRHRWRPSRSRRRRSARRRIARVRGVIAASTSRSSRLSVSGRMSTNTGRAPRSTKALTVDTKVNAGQITSSPGADVEQQRRHLERVRARRGQQHPAARR